MDSAAQVHLRMIGRSCQQCHLQHRNMHIIPLVLHSGCMSVSTVLISPMTGSISFNTFSSLWFACRALHTCKVLGYETGLATLLLAFLLRGAESPVEDS